jgi:hypothetical protein
VRKENNQKARLALAEKCPCPGRSMGLVFPYPLQRKSLALVSLCLVEIKQWIWGLQASYQNTLFFP